MMFMAKSNHRRDHIAKSIAADIDRSHQNPKRNEEKPALPAPNITRTQIALTLTLFMGVLVVLAAPMILFLFVI